mgnify:CR=1 FL=1
MTGPTLVLPGALYEQLRAVAAEPLETAGVLLASMVSTEKGIRLLGREYHPVPQQAYRIREVDRLGISSEGYVPALSRAERIGAVAIWFHTHPGDGSWPAPESQAGGLSPFQMLRKSPSRVPVGLVSRNAWTSTECFVLTSRCRFEKPGP